MEMDEFGAVGRFGKSLSGAAGLTVVVEFESGGEGGAFEMGAAPEGSPELGRLVSCARRGRRSGRGWGRMGCRPHRIRRRGEHRLRERPDRARCRRGVKRTRRARACHRRARASFSGDASRHPRTPARQGAAPLGTLAKATRETWRMLRPMHPAASIDLNLMLDLYGLEFGGFRYFVAPQEEHLYPVVTVSSQAALT